MNGRETILSRLRQAVGGSDEARRAAVAARLVEAPAGLVPKRGQLPDDERVSLFCRMAETFGASLARVKSPGEVPGEVAAYLRARNLPASIRMGGDGRLAAMGWAKQKALEVKAGASDGSDEVCVSHAFAGIAETGTLALVSGQDNPTTLNFLPEHHVVVVDAGDIAGDYEAVLERIRATFGKGIMPRTLNLVTGPSRSGDIEQTIILGAHGPRALHIVVVG